MVYYEYNRVIDTIIYDTAVCNISYGTLLVSLPTVVRNNGTRLFAHLGYLVFDCRG